MLDAAARTHERIANDATADTAPRRAPPDRERASKKPMDETARIKAGTTKEKAPTEVRAL